MTLDLFTVVVFGVPGSTHSQPRKTHKVLYFKNLPSDNRPEIIFKEYSLFVGEVVPKLGVKTEVPMNGLTPEQIGYAVTFLRKLIDQREITQTDLVRCSKVAQSEISKILHGEKTPSMDQLSKLSKGLGFKLSEILDEIDDGTEEILGYLATPLTAVVTDGNKEKCLKSLVQRLKNIASATEFSEPRFNLYWPGDFTHPVNHKQIPAKQVYITDRSRASAFDFIVLFCAEPSYGVGQENEISTQAGLPAIRLAPEGMSRMMLGSLIRSTDVKYSGSLATTVDFDESEFKAALWGIRKLYFRLQAFYRRTNGNEFGERLRHLINDRTSGGYAAFAEDIGVGLSYVNAMMEEPFTVSNPSARILKRMSVRLQVGVGYLLGEAPQIDTLITESKASWGQWLKGSLDINGALAVEILDDWEKEVSYARSPSVGSARNLTGKTPMKAADWDRRYQEKARTSGNGSQRKIL